MLFILLVGKQDVFLAWYLREEAVGLGLIALLLSVPFEFPFCNPCFSQHKTD